MRVPKVSFVVPCFKLAHLLRDCISSILSQTYQDFEILVMDDQSPDDTPTVARSFDDSRVQHIRNEPNLGHLRNYNKGISLARGEYVWLISADDWLRSNHALERYVDLMNRFPDVGYVFCPAMKVVDGREMGVMQYSVIANEDVVLGGHDFLARHLVFNNIVPAPAAMARKKCYEQVSYFPLDLPHTGDWYLWAMYSLFSDVGFFREPMVSRRFHAANMSSGFYKEAVLAAFANNLAITARLWQRAQSEGYTDIVAACRRGMVAEYFRQRAPAKSGDPVQYSLTDEEFEDSLARWVSDSEDRRWIRARVCSLLADQYHEARDTEKSKHYYEMAIEGDPGLLKSRAKYLLAQFGPLGELVRRKIL